mgnify:CR=1 FL=1
MTTKNIVRSLTIGLSLALVVTSLQAEAGREQRRNRNQQHRIREGVASGELTNKEARKLERGERRIHKAERRARQDGVVTAGERAKIEHMQDNESKKIYQEKHDDQKRPE